MTQCSTDGNMDTASSLEDGVEKQIIPFNKPHLFPGSLDAIRESFVAGKASGDGINTRRVTGFFSSPQFFGHPRVLLTPSCTAALEMAALVLDLGKGDEVIVPSFTFVSTANAFALRGVTLVFADSESATDVSDPFRPNTPNVDVQDILRKVTPKTKAIVVVHYAGVAVDLRPLQCLGIPIVEDCAHAMGSIDPTTHSHTGLAGCLSTFSFHDTKNIGIGEGGCLVVNDSRLWDRACVCRDKGTNYAAVREGRDRQYSWHSLGSSYLMSDVDAGVLWGCLLHYDSIQLRRLQIWDFYHERIWSTSNLWCKPSCRVSRTNGHMYYLHFFDPKVRQEFHQFMQQRGIVVTSHYQPLDTSPFIRNNPNGEGPAATEPPHCCKNAELWSKTIVRLPIYFDLTMEQQARIIDAVNSFTLHKARSRAVDVGDTKDWTLRLATPEFWEDIRQIRNAHRFKFQQTDVIDAATHRSFMQKHWCTYRVAVAVDPNGDSERVIGFVGQVQGDVRIGSHPEYLRIGVGKYMLRCLLNDYPDVTLKARRENHACLALTRGFGYIPNPKDWASGAGIVNLIHRTDVRKLGSVNKEKVTPLFHEMRKDGSTQ